MSLTKSLPSPPPRWLVELNSPPPSRTKNSTNIPDPPEYASTRTGKQKNTQTPARKPPTQEETDTLKLKKAWEIAFAPGKQLPMQAIMSYMSGNGLQIFSIMMVFMLFKGPIQAIAVTNPTFSRLQTEGNKGSMFLVKLVYIVMQCSLLALGVWKIGKMGLLPTTQSDWLAFEDERSYMEKACFAF